MHTSLINAQWHCPPVWRIQDYSIWRQVNWVNRQEIMIQKCCNTENFAKWQRYGRGRGHMHEPYCSLPWSTAAVSCRTLHVHIRTMFTQLKQMHRIMHKISYLKNTQVRPHFTLNFSIPCTFPASHFYTWVNPVVQTVLEHNKYINGDQIKSYPIICRRCWESGLQPRKLEQDEGKIQGSTVHIHVIIIIVASYRARISVSQ